MGMAAPVKVLAIETSCDETAAAVVADGPMDGPVVLSNVVHSQVETHGLYGGVVPEIASREHVDRIDRIAAEALGGDGWLGIDAIAATRGPGLVGALLVGVQFAKGLAMARGLPWIGVNHLEGHLSASLLLPDAPPYPHVALVVSGGHTQLYLVRAFGDYETLGGTRDDAAGEAFDKVAKMLGLGYPGGVAVDRLASSGDKARFTLPRALDTRSTLDFSFSGLKTAARLQLEAHGAMDEALTADFCASLQEAICDILTKKAVRAARAHDARAVVLAGGVAANSRLRALLAERCAEHELAAVIPPKPLCTDNAAMIGAAAWMRLQRGETSGYDLGVRSRLPLGARR